MNIFIYTAALVSFVSSCKVEDNNPVLNPECNYAGTCIDNGVFTYCDCCVPKDLGDRNPCGDSWVCDVNNPSNGCNKYEGHECNRINSYYYVTIGLRMETIDVRDVPDITCTTIPKDRYEYGQFGVMSTSILLQVRAVVRSMGWEGTVQEIPFCDTCSPAYPCTLGISDGVNATEGIGSPFQLNLNEYYDAGCSAGTYTPVVGECEANFDYGLRAHSAWAVVQQKIIDNELVAINKELSDLGWDNTKAVGFGFQDSSKILLNVRITMSPTPNPTSYPTGNPTSHPSPLPTDAPTRKPTYIPTDRPSFTPTSRPTTAPSSSPTTSPSMSPTLDICGPYTNDVESIVFEGVGKNCRAGLDSSWPGGFTCDSPYMVCLPQENTPATYGGEPYKSSTYRYSVSECKQECANDQRCVGIEFRADVGSSLGDCNLIDDFPMVIADPVSGFTYNPTNSYTNLDGNITNGDVMCFSKTDTCVPYFEADELNEVMLDCYCPNNRKGYYTKKVKRTVSNTRFCGSDLEVERRIKKAQANRMFHLCENWCLFQTENPEAENWYWDPWKTCWREQYAGVGEHMSYCPRVIRNPDTIEMQFVNRRSTSLCQTQNPTAAPVVASPSWFMAQEEESCDDACIDNNMVCHEEHTANVIEPNNLSEGYFGEAGVVCSSIAIGELDWAFPGYEAATGACFTRNNDTENTGCNYAIGVGYRRLCACISGDQ